MTGLIGVNGAGKSTLMQVMAGSLKPSSGSSAFVDGSGLVRSSHSAEARKHIAFMPQDLVLPDSLRALDFIRYMAWVRGVPRKERKRRSSDSLEAVGLQREATRRIGELSGGMRRRLVLAQSIVGRPQLLLLDEPTASLDPEQRAEVRQLIHTVGEVARAVVVSSHEIEDLALMSDQILMLDHGRSVFEGSPEELKHLGGSLLALNSNLSPYEAAFLRLRRDGERVSR